MHPELLPLLAPIAEYDRQADALLAAHRAGDPRAIDAFHQNHPRFLDDTVCWLPKRIPPEAIRDAPLDIDDARLVLARSYSYRDWAALTDHVSAIGIPGSAIRQYETAAEAVITGDLATLRSLLAANPSLARARSERATCYQPSVHRATLLHYLGANGIEGYRQRSPKNAVEVAALLFEAGAEADALAGMYGGEYATMSMLVSSTPPAEAGVQVGLIHSLLDHGAAIDGVGSPQWGSPLLTALAFGFREAAEALAVRGARVDTLPAAAGLGRLREVVRLLPAATDEERHRALALAAQLGHAAVVGVLLDAGEDPDRFNPDGLHSHSTPLHQAAVAGHHEVVRILVGRGARLDIKDKLWVGTPLGWARHGEQQAVAEYLTRHGARDD
ncbi:MAG: ankyrin repeat domain-containing protein [Gemmatimonadales bacterium]